MQIQVVSKLNTKKSTVVVFAKNAGKSSDVSSAKKSTEVTWLSSKAKAKFSDLVSDKVFLGNAKEALFLRGLAFEGGAHSLLVGLGSLDLGHESWRQAGAQIFKVAFANKLTSLAVDLSAVDIETAELKGLIEGLRLAAYRFDELKSKPQEPIKLSVQLKVDSKFGKEAGGALKEATLIADAVNFAKRLGDLPGNHLTPTILAKEVQSLFKGSKAQVTVWDKKRIEKEKMGGLLAVARGSDEEPRFIIIEYKGAPAAHKPIAFVGKGLTFDTGGISIKPSAAMEEMKFDMCGSAGVIGAMYAIAKSGLAVNAIACISATENMPGGSAIKPGDVYKARNGKTVEVNNTDAEGRLILGEALVYASEQKPQWIVDAATLTGAMVVALGNIYTGYFTRSKDFKAKIEEASCHSGELVWNMPLCDYHVEDIKGVYADLSNISSAKGAGSSTAAAFLEQFVDKSIPWAHFDIAGTAWAAGNRLNYCTPKGGTGVMVRTFFELARLSSAKK